MEFVASEWSGTDFVASDWTDTALFTSEFLAARLSTLEVCVGDLYYRVGRSYGGESRLLERDQLYGHAGKVSQSKLRRLRAKRLRYRLWSTAQGPDSSCLVHAGICAPRYYRNFCSDDSEEEEWVEHTDTQVQDAGTYTVPPLQFPANGAHINSEVRFSSTNLGVNAGAAEPIPRSGSRWFKGGSRELAVRTGVAAVHVESHSQLQDAGVQTVSTARVASKLQVSQDASERDCEISLNAECHFASELECEIAEASTKVEAGTKVEVGNQLCEEECRGEYQCTHTWTRDATDSGEKDRAVRAQPQSRDPTFAQKSGISDPNSGDRPKEPTEAQSLLRSAEASTKVEVGNQMCEEEVEEECDGIKEEDHSIRVNPNVDPEEFRRRCEHTQAEKTTPFSRNGSFSYEVEEYDGEEFVLSEYRFERKYRFERPIVTDKHAIASAWQQWQRGLDPKAPCSCAPDSGSINHAEPHTFQELKMLQRLLEKGYSHADLGYYEGFLVANNGWKDELGVNSHCCIELLPRGCGGRWRSCCKNRVTVWHALQCSTVWDGAFHDEELMNDFLESVVARLRRDGLRIWEDVRPGDDACE